MLVFSNKSNIPHWRTALKNYAAHSRVLFLRLFDDMQLHIKTSYKLVNELDWWRFSLPKLETVFTIADIMREAFVAKISFKDQQTVVQMRGRGTYDCKTDWFTLHRLTHDRKLNTLAESFLFIRKKRTAIRIKVEGKKSERFKK